MIVRGWALWNSIHVSLGTSNGGPRTYTVGRQSFHYVDKTPQLCVACQSRCHARSDPN